MAKRGRIIGLAFALALSSAGTAAAGSQEIQTTVIEAQEGRIEQVYANLPELHVYGTGFSTEEVQAGEGYLSQEKLELVQAEPFSESGEGICYYVLLDISGSIPDSYFKRIKEGIQNLQDQLGEKDRLVLCAFGEEVILAADGSQTPEELSGILAGLDNRDQKTLLFEGIDRVASLAEQAKQEGNLRTVLAVISDGEDIAVGQKMAQEAQATLKEKGLPVYAFCIRDTATVNINTFGEFARTSGGKIVTFRPEEGGQMLCDLAEDLADDLRLEYRAATNVVTNKEELFNLKFSDERVISRAVYNNRWIPDTQPPVLLSAEAVGDQQIRLIFSEPMRGVEMSANYQLELDGNPVGVTGVSYDKNETSVVNLSLTEPVKNGGYTLTCSGITDDSMEKNPLSGVMNVTITNAPEPVKEPEPPKPILQAVDYTGVLFLIFAAVVVLIVVLIVKSKKKKTEKPEEPADAPAPVKETVLAGNDSFRQHVAMPSNRKLDIWISRKGKATQKTVWELGSSLIVGRSSICDIQVDDPEMSRQHFCLESENGNIYVSDLGSTNGTSVNGIRISKKRRLDPGAVIEAGSIKITIRW